MMLSLPANVYTWDSIISDENQQIIAGERFDCNYAPDLYVNLSNARLPGGGTGYLLEVYTSDDGGPDTPFISEMYDTLREAVAEYDSALESAAERGYDIEVEANAD